MTRLLPRPRRLPMLVLGLALLVSGGTGASAVAEAAGEYDPFEPFDPFDVRLASLESAYDPFDEVRPAVVTEPTSTIAFQLNSPQPTEPLPAPASPAAPMGPGTEQPRPDPDIAASEVPIKPLDELSTNIVQPAGMLPRDYAAERPIPLPQCFDPTGATRCWPVSPYHWVASGFFHNPLYFEEVNLERYGYGCCPGHNCCATYAQSVVSGAHFFGNVALLPYKIGAECPREHVYTLGHYRPGSCPPWRNHCCTRASCAGLWSAGGIATGLVFLIP